MPGLINIPVIWSDAALVVISKPAGILALPDGYDPTLPHVKSILYPQFGSLWIVHRLDRDTSGVMVLARTAAAHKELNTQFQGRAVKKVYKALVIGNPAWDRKVIELPLKVNAGRRHRTVVDLEDGKPSVTAISVIERFKDYSLVSAVPETGRRHQIRAHLAEVGFPIACDSLYGGQEEILVGGIQTGDQMGDGEQQVLLQRTALHASLIELIHPLDGQRQVFESPLPEDLAILLEFIRSSAPGGG